MSDGTTTALEGTDLEVFCVARAYTDAVQVTLSCRRAGDTAAVFGCWAHAHATAQEDAARASTFDTETVLGSGVGAECAELLARVLCERVAGAATQRHVVLSLALPRGTRTLDLSLLRQLAAVATARLEQIV